MMIRLLLFCEKPWCKGKKKAQKPCALRRRERVSVGVFHFCSLLLHLPPAVYKLRYKHHTPQHQKTDLSHVPHLKKSARQTPGTQRNLNHLFRISNTQHPLLSVFNILRELLFEWVTGCCSQRGARFFFFFSRSFFNRSVASWAARTQPCRFGQLWLFLCCCGSFFPMMTLTPMRSTVACVVGFHVCERERERGEGKSREISQKKSVAHNLYVCRCARERQGNFYLNRTEHEVWWGSVRFAALPLPHARASCRRCSGIV